MNISLVRARFAVASTLLLSLSITSPGIAAELEEIVVTATKREASAQDIPMSIQTLDGEKLTAMAFTDLGDLSTTIPGFSIGDGVTNNLVTMRGVGSGEDRSFEQSVSMFHDGVYNPRSRQTRTPFFDAERIEVLRGPQAVLFGLNSTAGAIAIHSAKNRPGDAFEAKVIGEYEAEYSGYRGTVILGGSPSDQLGLRLAVQTGDSGDGYISNATAGDVGDSKSTMARLTAVWEPSDAVAITGKFESFDYDVNGQTGEATNRAAAALEPGDGTLNWMNTGIGDRLGQLNEIARNNQNSPGAKQSGNNFSLNLDWDLGEYTLSALVAQSNYEYELATDLDTVAAAGLGLPGVTLDAMSFEDYEQTSGEIRLASPLGQKFEYVAGIYFQNADMVSDQPNIIFLPAPFVFPTVPFSERGNNLFLQDQSLFSAFFSATINVSDAWRIIAGVRYSDDEKDWSRQSICQFSTDDGAVWTDGNFGGGACATASNQGGTVSSSNTMPEFGVQFDFSDNAMAYFKYAESAKSGGAATGSSIPDGSIVYGDESVDGFELGLKTTFANGAAEFNIAAFSNEFTDLQVKSSFVAPGTVNVITNIGNAGQATSEGVEIDTRWAASDVLTVGASLTFLDASYDSFDGISCNTSGSTPVYTDPSTGLAAGCSAGGQSLPFAADTSGTVFADINVPLSNGLSLVGGLNISLTDDHFTDGTLEPTLRQDSYTRIDARIGLAGVDNKWSVSLIGKNLSDEEINMSSQPLGAYDLAYLMMPMTLTVQGQYNFGE